MTKQIATIDLDDLISVVNDALSYMDDCIHCGEKFGDYTDEEIEALRGRCVRVATLRYRLAQARREKMNVEVIEASQ